MARFDFQSPGAAFTSQIAQALAQRKAEERQNMLDQLTVNAEGRAQEAANRQRLESEANLATNAQARELARLRTLEEPGFEVGEDISKRFSPEDAELLRKYGRLAQLPTPNVSTETSFAPAEEGVTMDQSGAPAPQGPAEPSAPPAAPKFGAVGTIEQRDKNRLRTQSATVVSGLMQDPKTAEVGKFLSLIMQANDGILPPDVLASQTAPDIPIATFNEPTGEVLVKGKPVSSLRPNTKVVQRNFPPYHPPPTPTYLGMDENGNVVFDPRNGSGQMTYPGVTRPKSGSGSTSGKTALGLDQSYLDDLDLKEGALGTDPRAVDPTALEGYRGSMGRAFANAKMNTTPRVRQLAIKYLNNPTATTEEFMQLLDSRQLTKQEANDFFAITDAISPAAKQVLIENPYDPSKKTEGGIAGFLKSLVGGK